MASLVAVGLALSPAAFAVEEAPKKSDTFIEKALTGPAKGPDPYLAGALAVAPGLALYGVAGMLRLEALNFAIPLTFGAGHLYAGNPWRGLAMSAGGYGAAVAGGGLGAAFALISPGTPTESVGRVLWAGALAAMGFGGFAAWDAYQQALPEDPPAVKVDLSTDPAAQIY